MITAKMVKLYIKQAFATYKCPAYGQLHAIKSKYMYLSPCKPTYLTWHIASAKKYWPPSEIISF